MHYRVLFGLIFAVCLWVGHAQAVPDQVVTGYMTTSGCPSVALTPCFVQFGAAAGGSAVSITAPLGVQTGAASVAVICNSGCSGGPADEATFTPGTTATVTGGFFQTTATNNALTNLQSGSVQLTANRAFFVNLRNASGAELGVAAAPVQVSLANTASNATAVLVSGAGGTFPISGATSNASSAVATSSTNAPTVAYNYGFNGTTWDQIQVDASKNLKTTTVGTGTAGSAASGVLTVQGIASMTKLLVTPDSVALPANQSVNESQINGVSPLMGNGVSGTGSQRVNIASDNTAFSVVSTSSGAITNPTSTLTMTAATTAYTAGQLIATSATAGSVVVPSFAIANSAGGAIIPRLRLSTNDTVGTAWGAASIQVDLWSAAPTWTNGDRAAWSPATGTAAHLGSYACTVSAEYGDGAYAECSPSVGNAALPKLASGTLVFWSLKAVSGSGVTGASKVWTLTAEELN